MLAAILSMNYSYADFSDFESLSESELSCFRFSEVADLGSSNFLFLIWGVADYLRVEDALGVADASGVFFTGDLDSADKVMTLGVTFPYFSSRILRLRAFLLSRLDNR
jgi:hypothetical protein